MRYAEQLEEALRLYGIDRADPALLVWPEMSAEDFAALCSSGKTGWRTRVTVIDEADGTSTLIDGRHRLMASVAIGLDIKADRIAPPSDRMAYTVKCNGARNHYTKSQLAVVAVDMLALYDEQAKARKSANGGDKKSEAARIGDRINTVSDLGVDKSTAAGQAAAAVGVAESTVEKAKRLTRDAPDLAGKVRDGEISIPQAEKELRTRPKAPTEPKSKKTPVTLVDHNGVAYDYLAPAGKSTFNKTNDSVDWASWTWNPVTGCLHGCGYCYAREIAHQAKMAPSYPAGFTPLFHPERLDAPSNTAPGTGREQDGRVFVCSMADLFGEWVPEEWIADVFAACNAAPAWEYLFLTKFPKRYRRLDLPPNMWAGASVDTQKRVKGTEAAMRDLDVKVRWLSVEPLLEPLKFDDLSWCDLIVIGAQSATRQPEGKVDAFAPPFDWVSGIVAQAREAGVPVYLKANLLGVTDQSRPGMDLPREKPRRRASRAEVA